MKLTITADTKGLKVMLDNFIADQKVAVVRALNKTAMQARTEAAKSVQEAGYTMKASAIKASFSIQKATKNSPEVLMTSTGRPISLINYNARQLRSGVSVSVKTGRKVMRHAFIVSMKNGHKGVFVRAGGKGSARLPIKELYGPSIPTALSNSVVVRAIENKIREKFPQILSHEIQFALKGRGKS